MYPICELFQVLRQTQNSYDARGQENLHDQNVIDNFPDIPLFLQMRRGEVALDV